MQRKTVTIPITDEIKSGMFAGYRLPVEEIDGYIDDLIELIVFYDPNRGRYVSSIDDWQENGVDDGSHLHLRQSYMDRS